MGISPIKPRIIAHLDLDAFFAAVEQRDKPSLRGKPVIVGGSGLRGVVATASYEARRYGVHSAMSTAIARRRIPHGAYLAGRFEAYRQSSRIVMNTLRSLSPLVEPVSIDEAYIDLTETSWTFDDLGALESNIAQLRQTIYERTEGLTCSVGVGQSKLIAKLASEAAKPDGHRIITADEQMEWIAHLPVSAIPGVGPATQERLMRIGIATVEDIRSSQPEELVRQLGKSAGENLYHLAFARDDRPVEVSRGAKSISVEDTFTADIDNERHLVAIADKDIDMVVQRLSKNGLFARTVTIKLKMSDFTTWTRSHTLEGATDSPARLRAVVHMLIRQAAIKQPIRLLGVGVSNFTESAQEQLFFHEEEESEGEDFSALPVMRARHLGQHSWRPGQDVEHRQWGRGWVWGAGEKIVTVRFEYRHSPVGTVRSFPIDDPDLQPAQPLAMAWEKDDEPIED